MKFIHITKKSILRMVSFIAILMILSTLRPLSHPDEGRYAEIGRWMLQSGDWLTPRLNGMPFFHKPPLLYWLEALSFSAFGIHPWVARLTPIFHAGLMLISVHVLMTRFGTEKYVTRAVAMVGTSLAFLAGGQYVNHDMIVATWISIAISSFAIAFMSGDKPDILFSRLGFVACGLGILSKGLIGVVLPGLVLLFWLVWTRQFKKIRYLPWFSGLSLFSLIAVPWFVFANLAFPNMLNYMFGMHHLSRFTGTGFNNIMPWWFYLAALPILFFPWVFFPIVSLLKISKSLSKNQSAVAFELRDQSIVTSKLISLSWIWLITIIGFFSIPATKVIGYALPVIPPLAVLAAVSWELLMKRCTHERSYFIGLCVLNVILAFGLTLAVGQRTQKHSVLDVGRAYSCLAQPDDAIYVLDGYPYDLPFELKLKKPMLVVQDWAALRLQKSDNWHNELMDAASFAPDGDKVLLNIDQLKVAQAKPNNWLFVSAKSPRKNILDGWDKITQNADWDLYRSKSTGSENVNSHMVSEALKKCLQ